MTEDSLDVPPPADTSAVRLRRLLQEYFEFVWRTLRRLGLDDSEAEDASQEVFWVAARRLGRLPPENERSFLFGTALRVAAAHRRRRRRRAELFQISFDEQVSTTPDPEELQQWARARVLFEEILDAMDVDSRAVFLLFELEELSGPAIAELLRVPIGTVNSRLRRAREVFQHMARRIQLRNDCGRGHAR